MVNGTFHVDTNRDNPASSCHFFLAELRFTSTIEKQEINLRCSTFDHLSRVKNSFSKGRHVQLDTKDPQVTFQREAPVGHDFVTRKKAVLDT